MIRSNDIILYNEEKYRVLFVYETGYCEIQKMDPVGMVELIHRKDLKHCPKISGQ